MKSSKKLYLSITIILAVFTVLLAASALFVFSLDNVPPLIYFLLVMYGYIVLYVVVPSLVISIIILSVVYLCVKDVKCTIPKASAVVVKETTESVAKSVVESSGMGLINENFKIVY